MIRFRVSHGALRAVTIARQRDRKNAVATPADYLKGDSREVTDPCSK